MKKPHDNKSLFYSILFMFKNLKKNYISFKIYKIDFIKFILSKLQNKKVIK